MRQIALLVEGQTEERVVDQVLAPAAREHDIELQPIVVCTSAGHHGGGSWRHYHDKLRPLLEEKHWAAVGLLVDLYGYPKGAPGRSGDQLQDWAMVMAALRAEYPSPRLKPLVVPHETEAWVLAAIEADAGRDWLKPKQIASLRAAIDEAGGPEKVNSRPDLAPSKRLLAICPRYSKVLHGPQWIAEIGLDAVLERCPVFAHRWGSLLSSAEQTEA